MKPSPSTAAFISRPQESENSPSFPSTDSITLTQRQKNLAKYYQATQGRTSFLALGFFLLSCFGKLIFGFGAALTVKGVSNNSSAVTGAGAGLCGAGFVCILIVAFGFGAACSMIDPQRGIFFKFISISSAILIAGGYALNQYYVSMHRSLLDIRLSFIPLFFGASLLVFSITNFSAYTELVRGVTPGVPISRRPLLAVCLLSPGLGTVFAGWITGEKGEWPTVFNAGVLTIAMGCLYGGLSIFWSNHLRQEAAWAERCAFIEEYRFSAIHLEETTTASMKSLLCRAQ